MTDKEVFDIECALIQRIVNDDPRFLAGMAFAHWAKANIDFLSQLLRERGTLSSRASTRTVFNDGPEMFIKPAGKHVDWTK